MRNLRRLTRAGRLPIAPAAAAALFVSLSGAAATTAPVATAAPAASPQSGQQRIAGKAALAGVSWHRLTLWHGWKSSRSASYDVASPQYALHGGIVYLDGTLHQPVAGLREFGRLPAAARPAHELYLTALAGNATGGPASLRIKANGDLSVTGSGSRALTSLAAISFPAARSGPAWHSLAMSGNWSGAPILGARRASYSSRSGIVHLTGSLHVKPGQTPLLTAARLPRKYRPAYVLWLSSYTVGGSLVLVQITPAGAITPYGGLPKQTQTSLDGLSFPVAGARLGWHRLPLATGWSAQDASYTGNPRYATDGPIVYLEGAMVFDTTSAGSALFATMPTTTRTTHVISRVVATNEDSGELTIAQNLGIAGSDPPLVAQQFTSLAGISYPRNS
jgi:hypothetical protein